MVCLAQDTLAVRTGSFEQIYGLRNLEHDFTNSAATFRNQDVSKLLSIRFKKLGSLEKDL
jgi:hypothetical protein